MVVDSNDGVNSQREQIAPKALSILNTTRSSGVSPHEPLKVHGELRNSSPKDLPIDHELQTAQMNPSEHTKDDEVPLEELFTKQMDMEDKEEPMESPVNEDYKMGSTKRVLLVKPHGFKPPPIKIVVANLQNASRDIKGV